MAWTNASLTTALQRFTENTSTDFINSIPDLIRLAETRVFRETNLRIYNNTATGTLTSGTNTVTLPTDLSYMRSFTLATLSSSPLLEKHETFLKEYWPQASNTDEPIYFTFVDRTTAKVAPTPDSPYTYNINYRAQPTGLANSTDGTWLSIHGDDVLLYACIVEAHKFLKHMGTPGKKGDIDYWEESYQRSLLQFRDQHEGRTYSQEYRIGEKLG